MRMDVDTAIWNPTDAEAAPDMTMSAATPAVPCLELGRRAYPLAEGDNLVGRGIDASVQLDSPSVSRRHAMIRIRGGAATIEDLSSRNGTMLRDSRVASPAPIRDGDAIRIGTVWLVYREPSRGGGGDD